MAVVSRTRQPGRPGLAACILAGLCMLYGQYAAAGQGLLARIDRQQVQLGHPLRLTLRMRHPRSPLAALNLEHLKRDFLVYDVTSSRDTGSGGTRAATVETLEAVLYPRRRGVLHIPAFHHDGGSSRPLTVKVVPETASNILRLTSGIARSRSWVRQEVYAFVEVTTLGRLVGHDLPVVQPPGMHLRALDTTEHETLRDGMRVTVYRHAWAAMPLGAGRHRIDFPMLRLRVAGSGDTLRFYPLPALSLDARDLPGYLPVALPVSRILLNGTIGPVPLWSDRPHAWQLRLTGSGLSEGTIKRWLASQLHSDARLRFYPPTVSVATAGESTVEQVARIRVPFTPLMAGTLQLPALAFPYIDAASGDLQQARLTPLRITVRSRFWYISKRIVLAFSIAILVAVLLWRGWRQAVVVFGKRRCIIDIQNATTGPAMRNAVLRFGYFENGIRPATLQQWLNSRPRKADVQTALQKAIDTLQQTCYGNSADTDTQQAGRLHLINALRDC